MYTTLISPEALQKQLNHSSWRIFDCRFALADPEQGRRDYELAHIPGAIYADLNQDLCGPILTRPDGFTATGRHPLPDVDTFVATLNRWGVTNKTQVIAYDDKGGGLAAARLWWMLRWVGHDAVAVLDGGWQGWVSKQYSVVSGQFSEETARPTSGFKARVRREMVVSAEEVYQARDYYSAYWVFDSRTPERYLGETEPIDPVAGHIPWAQNTAYTDTQTPEGFFLSKEALQSYFEEKLGPAAASHAIFYCGSGVTAAANLLAMKHAGLGDGKLYAGSWSEWIADSARPVAFVQNYTLPLDQLLNLGEEVARKQPWPDYLKFGLTHQHIPDLIRMALDYHLHWSMPDDPKVFAPLHAWRALGQLRAEAAIQPLLNLFHVLEDSDWAGEELPEVYGLIGPAAIPALENYLQDTSYPLYPRAASMTALAKIGNIHLAARAECVTILTRQLERFQEQDEEFNAFLIGALIDLKAKEAAQVIEQAFSADRVDESIQGDWEDVQVFMGLLEKRITPQPHYNPFFGRDFSDEDAGLFTLPQAVKKDSAKEKAKRKLAKQSRKTNRKKKKKK